MGFTGQYVTGVWFGNDDYSDMAAGTTGGHMAAPAWRRYMVGAHTNMDIPQIPGLPLHPRQIEERQRLADIRRDDPGGSSTSGSEHIGPHQTATRPHPQNADLAVQAPEGRAQA